MLKTMISFSPVVTVIQHIEEHPPLDLSLFQCFMAQSWAFDASQTPSTKLYPDGLWAREYILNPSEALPDRMRLSVDGFCGEFPRSYARHVLHVRHEMIQSDLLNFALWDCGDCKAAIFNFYPSVADKALKAVTERLCRGLIRLGADAVSVCGALHVEATEHQKLEWHLEGQEFRSSIRDLQM